MQLDRIISANGLMALLISFVSIYFDWIVSTWMGHFSPASMNIIWIPEVPHIIFWFVVAFLGLAGYRASLFLTIGIFAFMPGSYILPIYVNLFVNFKYAFDLNQLPGTLFSFSLLASLIIALIGVGYWLNGSQMLCSRYFARLK